MFDTELAYAKINLNLYIGSKREDGYHPISSIMQTISLFDTLSCEMNEGSDMFLTIQGNDTLPSDSSNLVLKAANSFFSNLGIHKQVRFTLEKRIPVGAGLGGGSSDCAATLRLLNRMMNYPFTFGQLEEIASKLGSDIPFLIRGGIQLCEGRGEILSPLHLSWNKTILLCTSGEYVSTKDAYNFFDSQKLISPVPINNHPTIFDDIHFANSFEQVILPVIPLAKHTLELIKTYHPYACLMSGSGSSVYAIFDSLEDAISVQKELQIQSYLVKPQF